MLYSENRFRKQYMNLWCIRAIQEHSGARNQTNFFSQKTLVNGLAKYETANKLGELAPGGFEGNQTKDDKQFRLRLSNPRTRTL